MRRLILAAVLLFALSSIAQPPGARVLTVDDFASIRDVGDPQLSPDGAWVLYSVKQPDLSDDKNHTHIWMSSWDGRETVQLTFSKQSESTPRWSPNGKYISFVSSRGDDDEIDQLWIMNRQGGEAEKITSFEGSVNDYDWAPDSKRIAIVASDRDPLTPPKSATDDKDKKKTKPPIVIDRYHFKQDIDGYLTTARQHLYLFDLESRKSEPLTTGAFSESLPSFSPDGKWIAFVSNRDEDPDKSVDNDVWVVESRAGATPRKLTTYKGNDSDPDWESRPAWSPDGTRIAYLQGALTSAAYYGIHKL
ncbi:MAG: DPP IV N-terminal domain-containing protein, partial [Thermoanaerobaculia bacterium]